MNSDMKDKINNIKWFENCEKEIEFSNFKYESGHIPCGYRNGTYLIYQYHLLKILVF